MVRGGAGRGGAGQQFTMVADGHVSGHGTAASSDGTRRSPFPGEAVSGAGHFPLPASLCPCSFTRRPHRTRASRAGGWSQSQRLSYRGPTAVSRSPPSQLCGRAARCVYLPRVAAGAALLLCRASFAVRAWGRRAHCLAMLAGDCSELLAWCPLPSPLDRNFLQLLSDAARHGTGVQRSNFGAALLRRRSRARPGRALPFRLRHCPIDDTGRRAVASRQTPPMRRRRRGIDGASLFWKPG